MLATIERKIQTCDDQEIGIRKPTKPFHEFKWLGDSIRPIGRWPCTAVDMGSEALDIKSSPQLSQVGLFGTHFDGWEINN